ncbi:hypothetical protein MKW92_050663 [Papaver armeniacum]|nr:hypothetical protein MKW92_050663 [Papaver armeniacum]
MDDYSYTLLDKVGEGTFGCVWKAIDNLSADGLELPEVKALTKLYGDPNIVGLRKVIYESGVLYLVFDYVESTLHRLMQDKINLCTDPELLHGLCENRIGLFSESEIKGWSRQILLALTQMHRPGGYMHRDLKPDNLLVTKGGELIKIADFGQARQIDSKSPCSDYVTTRMYRAPEVLLDSVSYTSSVDMWAVGAIMAELYSFRPLFPGKNRADQLRGIQLANSCGYKFPQVHPYGLSTMIPSASHEAIDLIKPFVLGTLKTDQQLWRLCSILTLRRYSQQRIYPNQTCFGEKLFGSFSPQGDIAIEDLLERFGQRIQVQSSEQRIYPNLTCFDAELLALSPL